MSIIRENDKFIVEFNTSSGGISSIILKNDPHKLNWVEGRKAFGTPYGESRFLGVSKLDNGVVNKYAYKGLELTVTRTLSDTKIMETYEFCNNTSEKLTYRTGQAGINTPFNDSYHSSQICLNSRCHAHLWCGESMAYIYGLRMSGQPNNFGLVLESGRIVNYAVVRSNNSNDRGDFSVLFPKVEIDRGKKAVIRFTMFGFECENDFFTQANESKHMVSIKGNKFTYKLGETASFTINSRDIEPLIITLRNSIVNAVKSEDGYTFEHTFVETGEHHFSIKYNNHRTHIDCNVVSDYIEIVDNRLKFIVDNQQCLDKSNKHFGGYMLYDNETNEQFVEDKVLNDRNIARERVGMACAIIARLQSHKKMSEEQEMTLYNSLSKAVVFIDDNIVTPQGRVCEAAKYRKSVFHERLYNYSMYASMYAMLAELVGRKNYFDKAMLIMKRYYDKGGENFYAIVMPIKIMIKIARERKYPELNLLESMFRKHGDKIIEKSINYPKHEVRFEQSIVAPAVDILLECYMALGDEKYLEEAEKQLAILEVFCGKQPSYHMNEIAIRHWDGYWFGKSKLYGDTFPHYWSCINGAVYSKYAEITGKVEYQLRADIVLDNNLCLFNEEGKGSCAYIMPAIINKHRGAFYDKWANDQDWALYFMILYNSKWQK